jgi:hypothetical protein
MIGPMAVNGAIPGMGLVGRTRMSINYGTV